MAVPTSPTLGTITAEGLKKAGFRTTSPGWSTLLSRAQTEWMEEIKNEIWDRAKNLKMLQNWSVAITYNGQSRYPNPTDYASDMKVEIMTGSTYGTAQTGTASNITLSASETVTDPVGKEIVIYTGYGKGSISQITSYSTSTKVAEVTPDFYNVPNSSSGYLILDEYHPLEQLHVSKYDQITDKTLRGLPLYYYPIGDDEDGEFILYPVPYNSTIPYAMRMRYYCDISELDLTSDLMSTLYKRWRSVWVYGIVMKAREDKQDQSYQDARALYYQKMNQAIAREIYGTDMNNLRMQVIE